MYTVERADRMCAERSKGANGEFIVVIDLKGTAVCLPSCFVFVVM